MFMQSHISEGGLGKGTIYTLLDRLQDKGFIREIVEPPTPALQIARARHLITGAGQYAVQQYATSMNLLIPKSEGIH